MCLTICAKNRIVHYSLFCFLAFTLSMFLSCIGGSSSGADNPELTLTVKGSTSASAKYSIYTSDYNPVVSSTPLASGYLDSLDQLSITSSELKNALAKSSRNFSSTHTTIQFNVLVESDSLMGFIQNMAYDDLNQKFLLGDSILGSFGPEIVMELSKPFRSVIADPMIQANTNSLPYIYIPGTPWKAPVEANGIFEFPRLPSVSFNTRLVSGMGEIYDVTGEISIDNSIALSIKSTTIDTLSGYIPIRPIANISAGSDTVLKFSQGLKLAVHATIYPDEEWDTTGRVAFWKALPGSELAMIEQSTAWATNITFNFPGKYAFQVSSSVARQNVFDTLFVLVYNDSIGGFSISHANKAPIVFAGNDTVLYTEDPSWFLRGRVEDDGLPFQKILSTRWKLIDSSLATGFYILNPENQLTDIKLTQMGIYTIEFSATDGELTTRDTVMVSVKSKAAN